MPVEVAAAEIGIGELFEFAVVVGVEGCRIALGALDRTERVDPGRVGLDFTGVPRFWGWAEENPRRTGRPGGGGSSAEIG